jgi:ABC-type transport system substrate-binding protein
MPRSESETERFVKRARPDFLGVGVYYLNFGTHLANAPFPDLRVHQAAAYAVDGDAIIKRVLFGQGERYAEIGAGGTGYEPGAEAPPVRSTEGTRAAARGRLPERLRHALLQPHHAARAEHQGDGQGGGCLWAG